MLPGPGSVTEIWTSQSQAATTHHGTICHFENSQGQHSLVSFIKLNSIPTTTKHSFDIKQKPSLDLKLEMVV